MTKKFFISACIVLVTHSYLDMHATSYIHQLAGHIAHSYHALLGTGLTLARYYLATGKNFSKRHPVPIACASLITGLGATFSCSRSMRTWAVSSITRLCKHIWNSCAATQDSTIVQIQDLKQATLSNLDKECLVAFDIDQTLIRYKKTGPVTIEPGTADFVTHIQHNAKTIALTAAPVGELTKGVLNEDMRNQHLLSVGINFRSNWTKDRIFHKLASSKSGYKPQVPVFKHGILLTGEFDSGSPSQSKGKVLEALLEQEEWKPRHIIMFDDIRKNLESVSTMCKRHHIQFTGYWYRHSRLA